ncbi:hypothetical protein [Buchnera aphidicola]|uniref:hypothetical protein n=1 Tax=Buchnera aphidicola TaxID=9 RepID=UPI003BEED8F6
MLILCCVITSCSNIDNFQKKNIFLQKNHTCQLKKLIIPKGIHFPKQNKNYDIPYTQEELSKKKFSIFPPE